jgi:hypothetical protein
MISLVEMSISLVEMSISSIEMSISLFEMSISLVEMSISLSAARISPVRMPFSLPGKLKERARIDFHRPAPVRTFIKLAKLFVA